MNGLLQRLKTEFQDEDYRYAYAESFLNTKLASQIKTLREQRGKTQAEIAAVMGIKQPGYRRFEDISHSVWKTDSLWSIARALGVRLDVSFETFGTLPEQKKHFTKESLKRPEFKDDPAFKEPVPEPESEPEPREAFAQLNTPQRLTGLAGLKLGDQVPNWDARLAMAEAIMKWKCLDAQPQSAGEASMLPASVAQPAPVVDIAEWKRKKLSRHRRRLEERKSARARHRA